MSFLADTWPMWGAMALVFVLTYGAIMPYARKEAKRRREMEQDDE